jgi:hypothetical protein
VGATGALTTLQLSYPGWLWIPAAVTGLMAVTSMIVPSVQQSSPPKVIQPQVTVVMNKDGQPVQPPA